MILQALYEYYQRCDELPRPGLALKEFKYQIVLEPDGTFFALQSLMSDKKRGLNFMIPRPVEGRTGTGAENKPQLLWDSCDFVLGIPADANKAHDKDFAVALRKRANFASKLEALPDDIKQLPGVAAVLNFYRRKEFEKVPSHESWADFLNSKSNLIFKLRGAQQPVTCDPRFVEYIVNDFYSGDTESVSGRCLITGETGKLVRLFGPTPIAGGKSGAALVSFQKNCGYDSYGKEQCLNAPVSKEAEFACTSALQSLLNKDSRNKILLAGLTMVFWTKSAERAFSITDLVRTITHADKDRTNGNTEAVRAMLRAAYTGKLPADEAANRFYFLGLVPNIARISVVVWKTGTVGELGRNIEQFFLDFELDAAKEVRREPNIYGVLKELALEQNPDNLPKNLEARLLEAIIDGSQYPVTLLIQAINRIHADRKFHQLRIAAVKAYLNRRERFTGNKNKEITMSLDPENPNVGYQCGRLFAVLEKVQSEAIPGLNATVCDRFYGAASSTPVTVFGRLLDLNLHHLEKIKPGRKVFFKNLISDIIDRIHDFPTHLNLEDQGRFAIGYYHQNRNLSRDKKTDAKPGQN